ARSRQYQRRAGHRRPRADRPAPGRNVMASGPQSAVRYSVSRLTVQTGSTPAEFQRRYEEAVPPLPAARVAALVQQQAPWEEMLDLVAAAAPHGFLIYFKNDVGPVVRL